MRTPVSRCTWSTSYAAAFGVDDGAGDLGRPVQDRAELALLSVEGLLGGCGDVAELGQHAPNDARPSVTGRTGITSGSPSTSGSAPPPAAASANARRAAKALARLCPGSSQYRDGAPGPPVRSIGRPHASPGPVGNWHPSPPPFTTPSASEPAAGPRAARRAAQGIVGVADRPGDFEYHARVNNNTATAGQQDVRWGLDRDLNGLDYRGINDSITVNWSADGLGGGSYYGR